MKGLIGLKQLLGKSKQESDTLKSLYFVMQKVGGYEQLLNLPLAAYREIIKVMEWEANETKKANKGKK